jgi:hypothetical protein
MINELFYVQDVNLNTLYCKRIVMSNEISYEM